MSITETLRHHINVALESQSMRSIARDSDVDYAVLHRFQSGERMPSGTTLDKLADYFGLTLQPAKKRAAKAKETASKRKPKR